ncbi:hypothetical protein [Pantoea piersonii]|uniref:hypothetical protein n=1 Tax=Pantoea piersonii TaxID=2364647 RepID=UPI00289C763B|nr:hypothetical protein [Pantoea piersonii]
MSEVRYAIAIVKVKLGNADTHNLGYQRFSIADMEAILGVLAKAESEQAALQKKLDAALEKIEGLEEDRRTNLSIKINMHTQLDEQKQKLGALAAENDQLRKWLVSDTMVPIDETEFSATDAYINSVRAEGVHIFLKENPAALGNGAIESLRKIFLPKVASGQLNAQLRAGQETK